MRSFLLGTTVVMALSVDSLDHCLITPLVQNATAATMPLPLCSTHADTSAALTAVVAATPEHTVLLLFTTFAQRSVDVLQSQHTFPSHPHLTVRMCDPLPNRERDHHVLSSLTL